MTAKTYRIAHITDLALVALEHLDEVMENIDHVVRHMAVVFAAVNEHGNTRTLLECCPYVDITVDGEVKCTSTLNGKPFLATTMEEVKP
jgi:hypothetical protein